MKNPNQKNQCEVTLPFSTRRSLHGLRTGNEVPGAASALIPRPQTQFLRGPGPLGTADPRPGLESHGVAETGSETAGLRPLASGSEGQSEHHREDVCTDCVSVCDMHTLRTQLTGHSGWVSGTDADTCPAFL